MSDNSSSASPTTYHAYQQIWTIKQQGSYQTKFKKPRRSTPRSSNGCLSCKKRRKKCDERKPDCKACVRNGIPCSWPGHVIVETNKGPSAGNPHEKPHIEIISQQAQIDKSSRESLESNQLGSLSISSDLSNTRKEKDTPLNDFSTPLTLELDSLPRRNTDLGKTDNSDLHHSFETQEAEKESLFGLVTFPDGFSLFEDQEITHNDALLDQFLFIQQENQHQEQPSSQISDHTYSHKSYSQISLSTVSDCRIISSRTSATRYDLEIIGLELSENDQLFYALFVEKFLATITPPHCHSLITPSKILLPYFLLNPIVREVFLTCGASFYAFKNNYFAQKAAERYSNCVDLLINEIQTGHQTCSDDHLFIGAQLLQTLCLRDRNIGMNATKCAAHLSASYDILRRRFLLSNSTDGAKIKRNINLNPLDRILAEHFVFNYPTTILFCHSEKLYAGVIPSPYNFFDQFNEILNKSPLTSNVYYMLDPNPWVTHPILGVSLHAQEYASKVSWLCRFYKRSLELVRDIERLKKKYMDTCIKLKDLSESYLLYLKSISSRQGLEIPQRLNIALTVMVVCSSLALVKKLILEIDSTSNLSNLDIEADMHELQTQIRVAYEYSDTPFFDIWALFISGVLTTDQTLKDDIEKGLSACGDWSYSGVYFKCLKFLRIFWQEQKDGTTAGKDGFEVILDQSILDDMLY